MKDFDAAEGYDIIGDVHGYAQELRNLLTRMDYACVDGVYRHPTRKAIFVGDLFNRGPDSVGAVTIVKAMVDAGEAVAVMGNHEYNDRLVSLRDAHGFSIRSDNPTMTAFDETIQEYAALNDNFATLEAHRNFLFNLPLYYQNDYLRVSHAYWNPRHVALLESRLQDGRITDAQMIAVEENFGDDFSKAVIQMVRGPIIWAKELEQFGLHQDGKARNALRVKWWTDKTDRRTIALRDALLDLSPHWENVEIPFEMILPFIPEDDDSRPHFFGHYRLNADPYVTSALYQCMDFAVLDEGRGLAAYRFDIHDSKEIYEKRFVYEAKLIR